MKHLIVITIALISLLGCQNEKSEKEEKSFQKEASNQVKPQPDTIVNIPSGNSTVEDGFYLILNTSEDSSIYENATNQVISFSHDFLEGNREGQPIYIEIDTAQYVPLHLSKAPKGVEQKDKRINLFLNMTEHSGQQLEEFTAQHVNQKTCIVVGGKAVTMHKIREKITGGKLQITRCTDNACKHLLVELKDNVFTKIQ